MVAAPIKPIEAHCAVGPDGALDIDLIRRNAASCQHAATQVRGIPWPRLVHIGWRVVRVRIGRADAEEVQPEPAPAPPPPAATRPRRAAPAGYSGPERMSASDYRAAVVRFGGRGA
jgi:hypothetical protein